MESLSALAGLSDLRLRGGADMRPTLLRVLTDLYVQKLTHTPDEERHYTELALRLLEVVDATTRTVVAIRLARHLSPPRRIIERLAADLPDVAAPLRGHPLLRLAPAVSGSAAMRITTPVSQPAPAVQQPAAVLEPLPVATAKVADESGHQGGDAEPTRAMIAPDVASELNEIFFVANAEERGLILLNLEIVAPLPAGGISLAGDGGVGLRLETAALTRNRENFVQLLADTLAIPPMQARRIASDELGEPIVTAAKALRLPRDVVYRILLFVNTTVGHSVERVHALAALHDEMTVQAAEHLVAIWQALQPQKHSASQYRSLLWNDETRARARSATPTVRPRAGPQRPGERRDAS